MVKKNSLSYFLLLTLEKSIEVNVRLIDFAYNSHKYAYEGIFREVNYGVLHKIAQDLRKRGFIETEKYEGKIILKLTDKGRQEVLIRKLLEEDKWDGRWRIVIFDIPENKRKLRKILRSKLREWAFKPWQKSVWIGKANVAVELRDFINEIGISEWVKVILSEDIGEEIN